MAEPIVLDANVIVALLYEQDAKHADAKALIDRISAASLEPQLVDFLVLEALSVLGRRGAASSSQPRGRSKRNGVEVGLGLALAQEPDWSFSSGLILQVLTGPSLPA